MRQIIFAIITFTAIFVSLFYVYEAYYVRGGEAIVQLRNAYDNAYAQIVSGSGKVCAPGEIGFAVYVKWDPNEGKFVKMCVYPNEGGEEVSQLNNIVTVVSG